MTTIHHPTSRPITNKCLWEWPVAGEDFIHDKSAFTRTNSIRSFYVIHPDWISEDFNRPRSNGRSNKPWPWEFPGARSTYTHPTEYYRQRVNTEMKIEDAARKVTSADPHYKVAHSSPPHINNPNEVQYSSVDAKRDIRHPWVMSWNNQRPILKRELSLPPLADRLQSGDLAANLERGKTVHFGETPNGQSDTSMLAQKGSMLHSSAYSPRRFPYTYAQSLRESSAPTREEVDKFRRLHNTYMTACSWQ